MKIEQFNVRSLLKHFALIIATFAAVFVLLSLPGCDASMNPATNGGGSGRKASGLALSDHATLPSDYLSKVRLSCRSGSCNRREQAVGLLFIEDGVRSGTLQVERCVGTLITNKHVLTAGHCFEGKVSPRAHFILPNGTRATSKSVQTHYAGASISAFASEYEGELDYALIELNETITSAQPVPVETAGAEIPPTAIAVVINFKYNDLTWDEVTRKADRYFEFVTDSFDCRINQEAFLRDQRNTDGTFPFLGLYGCPMMLGNSGGALFAASNQRDGHRVAAVIDNTYPPIPGRNVEQLFNVHKEHLLDYLNRPRGRGFLEQFEELTTSRKEFFYTTAGRTACFNLRSAGLNPGRCQSLAVGQVDGLRRQSRLASFNEAYARAFALQRANLERQVSGSMLASLQWMFRAELKVDFPVASGEGAEPELRDILALYPISICHKVDGTARDLMQIFRGGHDSRVSFDTGFFEFRYGPWNRPDLTAGVSGLRLLVQNEYQGRRNNEVLQLTYPQASPLLGQLSRLAVEPGTQQILVACPPGADEAFQSVESNYLTRETEGRLLAF